MRLEECFSIASFPAVWKHAWAGEFFLVLIFLVGYKLRPYGRGRLKEPKRGNPEGDEISASKHKNSLFGTDIKGCVSIA